MAEQAQNAANAVKDAVQNVTEKVGELTTQDNASEAAPAQQTYLDEVTGERVSKSELKKRQKLREKEAKKAEKAAAAPPKPQPKKKAGAAQEEEAQLNPNVCQS